MIDQFKSCYGYPEWPVKFRVGARHTTPFGLDDTFREDGRPLRIHAATDRGTVLGNSRSYDVYLPFDVQRAVYFASPKTGFGFILRLFIADADFEMRVMHMRPDDFNKHAKDRISRGKPLKAGTHLGSAGNAGISVGAGGEHTHTELVSINEKSMILEALTRELACEDMDVDFARREVEKWTASKSFNKNLYREYKKEREARNVHLFNNAVCRRIDYLTDKRQTFYNSDLVFNGL